MRTTQCVRAGLLMGALGACLLVAGAARALDETTERPGSLLIFPKVVNDGTRETVIQITNTSNTIDEAWCFYINGQMGPTGQQPLCSETDFNIALTRQQPTHWAVSDGRFVGSQIAGPGLPPGNVPPVPQGFRGALVCVEVDASNAPLPRNALKGEATFIGPGTDAGKYNGIAFTASDEDPNTRELTLDNAEYAACPAGSRINFINPGVVDPVVRSSGNWGECLGTFAACSSPLDCGPGLCLDGVCRGPNSPPGTQCDLAGGFTPCPGGDPCVPLANVLTNITALPCNLDLNAAVIRDVRLHLEGTDGEEVGFSGNHKFSCWDSFTIVTGACSGGDIPGQACMTGALSTQFATLEMTATSGGPVVAVAQAIHVDSSGDVASAATNVHIDPLLCVNGDRNGLPCRVDADCPGGGACPVPSAKIILPGS